MITLIFIALSFIYLLVLAFQKKWLLSAVVMLYFIVSLLHLQNQKLEERINEIEIELEHQNRLKWGLE